MEIEQMAVLSTSHLSPSDTEVLSEGSEEGYRVIPHQYGWIITTGPAFESRKLSLGVVNLVRTLRLEGVRWVNFDRDECPDERFVTHDW